MTGTEGYIVVCQYGLSHLLTRPRAPHAAPARISTMPAVSAEIEQHLTSDPSQVAYLSTCTGTRPHVAPVWYRYEDGVVEIVTTGRKLANLRENPRVSLAVSADTEGVPEWTVTLQGTATVVDDAELTREANARINRRYGMPEDAWEENVLVRIAVGSASLRTYD